MDEVRVEVPAHSSNLSRREWWDGTLPAALEDGVLVGGFLPPPPRPAFLDGRASSDGLTTCDLCTWALSQANIYTLDATLEIQDEIGWVLTLVIVSIVSAVIGAIIMIIVLQCKRLKSNDRREQQLSRSPALRPPMNIPDDKSIAAVTPVSSPSTTGVWSWLSRRSSTGPSQLDNPLSSATENHYTHMAENYNSGEEAFYTELDNDSNPTYHESGPTYQRNSSPVYESTPAYQNSAYTDPDFQVSSAPSSAYYSDLSITAVPDRAYEVVGLATMPTWDNSCGDSDIRRIADVKLSSISENVLTDYV